MLCFCRWDHGSLWKEFIKSPAQKQVKCVVGTGRKREGDMGRVSFTLFFCSGGRMRCSGPARLPGAASAGLTCGRERGEGALPPPTPPRTCLSPLRSVSFGSWTVFSERGRQPFPTWNLSRLNQGEHWKSPRVSKVRLGRGWGNGRGGPGAPHRAGEKTPRAPQGRPAAGRAPGPSALRFPGGESRSRQPLGGDPVPQLGRWLQAGEVGEHPASSVGGRGGHAFF